MGKAVSARTVRQLWEHFAKQVIPENAPQMQRFEMQGAFYTGALAVLQSTQEYCREADDDAGAEYIRRLESECESFFRVRTGPTKQ